MQKIYLIVASGLVLTLATPAFATTIGLGAPAPVAATSSTSTVKVSSALQTRISNAITHADQEINRRTSALGDLGTTVQGIVKLTSDEKTNIANIISAQVSALNDLKTKIDADTDIATIKTDIKSIADSYRIYMLVLPQGRITIAADKLASVLDVLSAFETKLSARIDEDAASGKDMSNEKTMLADMQAKIGDASQQSDAALNLVKNLSPDNGDKTTQASNSQALKDARAKIKTAIQDIDAAHTDARNIVNALKGARASSTAATSTNP